MTRSDAGGMRGECGGVQTIQVLSSLLAWYGNKQPSTATVRLQTVEGSTRKKCYSSSMIYATTGPLLKMQNNCLDRNVSYLLRVHILATNTLLCNEYPTGRYVEDYTSLTHCW